jgi:transposase
MEMTVECVWTPEKPERLIGDKAYDSDKHDERLLKEKDIVLIAPNKVNRKSSIKKQDGRVLRRYKRRWKVERINAWLQNFRRIVVRWEYKAENYASFVLLGCLLIIIRNIDF